MLNKSKIIDYRAKLMLGLRTIPIPDSTEAQRKIARIGAIYALGKVLELQEQEVHHD